MKGFIAQLHTKLEGSKADWKIVFGHHPMYTQGIGHGEVARCLRRDPVKHAYKPVTASSSDINSDSSSSNDSKIQAVLEAEIYITPKKEKA